MTTATAPKTLTETDIREMFTVENMAAPRPLWKAASVAYQDGTSCTFHSREDGEVLIVLRFHGNSFFKVTKDDTQDGTPGDVLWALYDHLSGNRNPIETIKAVEAE